jgi:acetyl-CoA synthetase
VLTADGTWRRGTPGAMKAVLDEALLPPCPACSTWWCCATWATQLPACPMQQAATTTGPPPWRASRPNWPTAEMAADDPAVLLYTSGTTGKPKGCVWTHVSFLGSMVTRDMHICADFKASDRFFFMSDMGWMVGAMCACIPSYFGGSLLVAEGTPDFPRHRAASGAWCRTTRSPTWAWRRR